MKVLFVIASLSGGGAEKSIANLASLFSKKSFFEVSLLTLCGTEEPVLYQLDPNVNLVRAGVAIGKENPIWSFSNFKKIYDLRKMIQSHKPDVVVSFVEKTNILILFSLIFSGIPVIACERTVPVVHDIGKFWNFLRRIFYPFARFVVFQTEFAKNQLPWVKSKRAEVIPNFLISEKIKDNTKQKKIILTVGRLSEEKEQILIVKAFSKIAKKFPDWKLQIVGDGPLRKNLEQEIISHSLEKSAKVIGWVKNPHQIFAESSIFVLSSRFEGFPNALLEAMSYGSACISTDCPAGPREIIQHGENGILIPVGDISELARQLEHLILNSSFRNTLGRKAKGVRKKFSEKQVIGKWEDLFALSCKKSTET